MAGGSVSWAFRKQPIVLAIKTIWSDPNQLYPLKLQGKIKSITFSFTALLATLQKRMHVIYTSM